MRNVSKGAMSIHSLFAFCIDGWTPKRRPAKNSCQPRSNGAFHAKSPLPRFFNEEETL